MELLPASLAQQIPGLYEQEGKGDSALVHAKFFLPGTNWTWYVLEYSPLY
jgi:hypothetical protein